MNYQTEPIISRQDNFQDDEINLIEYFIVIWRKKWWILLIVIISLIGCYIYNEKAPKIYSTKTTFFLSSDNGNNSMLPSYASFFGSGAMSALENNIITIFASRRMQEDVKNQALRLYPDKTISIKKEFGLVRLTIDGKTKLFSLISESIDPELAVIRAKLYLETLMKLNEEMNLSINRNLITILDEPVKPKFPAKPRKFRNLELTGLFSFMGSIFLFFGFDFFGQTKKNINKRLM